MHRDAFNDLVARGTQALHDEAYSKGYQKGYQDGREIADIECRPLDILIEHMKSLPDMTISVDILQLRDRYADYTLVDCGVDPRNGVYHTFKLVKKSP